MPDSRDETVTPFPHLMRPLRIGGIELPNRTVMGSMHTGLEDRHRDAGRLGAFYAERARGGVGLIVTGGIAPSATGKLQPLAGTLTSRGDVAAHRRVTDAVHAAGGLIAVQLLHSGRYGVTPLKTAPGTEPSPIHPFRHIRLNAPLIRHEIAAFGRAAARAVAAGYDAVEIMGGEGYLINQFLCPRTNDRTDDWGGSSANRRRFLLEVVSAVRERVPADFPVILRQSVADLVEGGQTFEEIAETAGACADLGVDAINTDIGWHESRVPTIVTSVPRAAFVDFTENLRDVVDLPLIAANRINTPEVAEEILARGRVDAVALARPLLADPHFVAKAAAGTPERINTCIGCNQACLDHAFAAKPVSCLVNPQAGRETTLRLTRARRPVRVAVVGAGPAGMAAAVSAAECGHRVDLFEASDHLGGQFALAAEIPGKEEFAETLRYFTVRLEETGVNVNLNRRVEAEDLHDFDHVLLGTGVRPRVPDIEGVDHPSVCTYADVLSGRVEPGGTVAVLGAGGIGFDVTEWLTTTASPTLDLAAWEREWGVSRDPDNPGSVTEPAPEAPARRVTMLQRTEGKMGRKLGKTTGWVHRAAVRAKGVEQISGVTYRFIDDAGVHVTLPDGSAHTVAADTVVLCTGQVSERGLVEPLERLGVAVTVIGGADVAAELDAKRAIRQGTEAAAAIDDRVRVPVH